MLSRDWLYYPDHTASPVFCSVSVNLKQVVHDTVQLPLCIYLLSTSEREAIQTDVAQVSEHRLHRTHPAVIHGRPRAESIFRFITCVNVSGLRVLPLKNATCRLGVLSGNFRQRLRSSQSRHADFGAWNFTAA
jgi:hypothetical protein